MFKEGSILYNSDILNNKLEYLMAMEFLMTKLW